MADTAAATATVIILRVILTITIATKPTNLNSSPIT